MWNEPMSRSAMGSAAKAGVATANVSETITPGMRDICCLPLVSCIFCGLSSGHAAKHAADGHSDSRRIALAQHVAGHDLAGGEHVGRLLAVLHQHPRLPVHAGAEIG